MITKKELGFVNSYANRVPHPGIDYCEQAMEQLEESLKLYKEQHQNRKYNISFSNNEEIEFQILEKNVCHMLGLDYKSLSSEFLKKFRKEVLDIDPEIYISSFNMVKSIIENKNKVLDYDMKNPSKAINYYKVLIKCDIFNKLSNFSNFNYGCINFDKDKYIKLNNECKFSSKSTKFLYIPSDEIVSPYFMMGLKINDFDYDPTINSESGANTNATKIEDEEEINIQNKSNNIYIVETLIAPEEVKPLFDNQEVIIPTQVLTDINGKLTKTEASATEKIKLLKDYQALINLYNLESRINIYGNYMSMLMSEQRKEENKVKTKVL